MLRAFALLLGFGLLIFPTPGRPQDHAARIALVVGIGSYDGWDPLPNATRDAELVTKTLHDRLGFTLIDDGPLLNPDKKHLEAAIRHLGDALGPSAVALFYYAGHGTRYNAHTSRPRF